MKLLGIDYGRRRIGIAATDATGEYIRGCATIDCKTCAEPISALADIIARESPGALVFGIPLGPHDEETAMSAEIRSFAGQLAETAQLKIPLHFIDESFSSIHAQKILRFQKKKQRRGKQNIDRIAACSILESFQRQQQ
jgi:putative Holliday junction resolvase